MSYFDTLKSTLGVISVFILIFAWLIFPIITIFFISVTISTWFALLLIPLVLSFPFFVKIGNRIFEVTGL